MEVIGLDGKTRPLKLSRAKRKSCSSHHEFARNLLKKMYPYETFYEEVTLPGTKTAHNGTLYADFLAPKLKLIIEIHGRQHYEYIPHFHKTKIDFVRGQNRDETKKEWAELNGFTLIELPYNEEDNWRKLIAAKH